MDNTLLFCFFTEKMIFTDCVGSCGKKNLHVKHLYTKYNICVTQKSLHGTISPLPGLLFLAYHFRKETHCKY